MASITTTEGRPDTLRAVRMEKVANTVVFGPVLDPEGGWGLGILRVADPAELSGFQQNDPTIRSGLGFKYQTFPIASLVIGSELRKREP